MSRTKENSEIRAVEVLNTSTKSFNSGKSDQHQFELPFHTRHCIFCVSECSAKFIVHDGAITRIKNEKEPSVIERQLKSLFIARNILGVVQKTCHELLTHFDGQLNPELWLNVCPKCNGFVEIYSKNLKEIAKLVREADQTKSKLKKVIWESNQRNSGEDKEEHVFSGVWKAIREQALSGFDPQQKSIVKVERDEDLIWMMSLIIIIILLNVRDSHSQTPYPNSLPKLEVNDNHHHIHHSVKSKRKALANVRNQKKRTEVGMLVKCCWCPAMIHKSNFASHRRLHQKDGSVVTCQFCGIYVHKSSLDFHQIKGKCGNGSGKTERLSSNQAKHSNNIIYSKENKIADSGKIQQPYTKKNNQTYCNVSVSKNPPKKDMQRGVSTLKNEMQRKLRSFRKKRGKAVTNLCKLKKHTGNIKTTMGTTTEIETDFSSRNHVTIFKEGRKKVEVMISRIKDTVIVSRAKKPTGNTQVVPRSQSEITNYYKCSHCLAIIEKDENDQGLRKHMQLHEPENQIKFYICTLCGWRVQDISEHKSLWHSKNKLKVNQKATESDWWMVDASHPHYILFRQQYSWKFECKLCPAKTISSREISDHSKLHLNGEGSPCQNCGWIVAPENIEKHEEKCNNQVSSDQETYKKCASCPGAKFLSSEHVRQHQILHIGGGWKGDECDVCGLKVESLLRHKSYFHTVTMKRQ